MPLSVFKFVLDGDSTSFLGCNPVTETVLWHQHYFLRPKRHTDAEVIVYLIRLVMSEGKHCVRIFYLYNKQWRYKVLEYYNFQLIDSYFRR